VINSKLVPGAHTVWKLHLWGTLYSFISSKESSVHSTAVSVWTCLVFQILTINVLSYYGPRGCCNSNIWPWKWQNDAANYKRDWTFYWITIFGPTLHCQWLLVDIVFLRPSVLCWTLPLLLSYWVMIVKTYLMRSEVLTAASIKMRALWDIEEFTQRCVPCRRTFKWCLLPPLGAGLAQSV
jgi:hypothetical protein